MNGHWSLRSAVGGYLIMIMSYKRLGSLRYLFYRSIFPARALAPFPTHENIYTLPNILTFSRLLSAPAIGYLILYDYSAAALLLFAYAGATDLVDGWIARKWGLQTVIGTVVDPLADKALMTSVTVCLALKGALPGMVSSYLC